ncbi:MAG: MFS transporter [Ruminococcus flavefaciens]|nr:MFS transporter [Ruminococcus flavefaciens]
MDSKVKTRAVGKKEMILGHLIGPLGLIFVVNTIAALVEKFFTQQSGLYVLEAFGGATQGGLVTGYLSDMGGKYELIMTVAKILAIGLGLLNGWLIQHTKSRQGRMRPWYLIFGFVSIIIGFTIFLFPGTNLGENYWYYFFIILLCYHTVGSTYFYLFRDNIVSITTHNPDEKGKLNFVRKVCWTLISGILIGMLVSNVLLPFWLENNISGYPILGVILSVIAIPLLLLEYFYTKERVIEDVAQEVGIEKENNIPLKQQVKALVTNKYWVILTVLTTIGLIVDNFKGGNVQYFYVRYMLGGDTNGAMFMMYSIITGIPLGLGAIIAYPLSKKIGVRNLSWLGYLFVLLGSIVGWMFPSNVPIAMLAGFLRQFGMIPNAYVFGVLIYYGFDSVEHRSGLRLEGLMGVAIFTMIQSAICAPFAGGYESMLLKLGFIDSTGVPPTEQVKEFMTLAFYLFDIILAVSYLILLPFIDVEKKMPIISRNLTRRRKEAVLARGEEWIDPEEQVKREREQALADAEENRIHDLREKCAKKGLDFETENAKYLKAKAEADAKWEAKQAKKKKGKGDGELEKAAEEVRLAKLKKHCELYGLDFKEENAKYLAKLAELDKIKNDKGARAEQRLSKWQDKEEKIYQNFLVETYEANVAKEVKALKKQQKREEKRIAKLKARCAKKGLNFDTENRKYLDEVAAKEVKEKAEAEKAASESK